MYLNVDTKKINKEEIIKELKKIKNDILYLIKNEDNIYEKEIISYFIEFTDILNIFKTKLTNKQKKRKKEIIKKLILREEKKEKIQEKITSYICSINIDELI